MEGIGFSGFIVSVREKLQKVITQSREKIEGLHIRLILLVGSQATGKSRDKSDIDMAVFVNPRDFDYSRGGYPTILELGVLFEMELKREDIDIVILNTANPVMKFNAILDGILLYQSRNGQYEDFHVHTLSEYYDYQYFLNQQFEYAKSTLRGNYNE
ncbi:MAG: hypothetical protein GF411_15650 [Candidatus Lokiarchaeota archaeon]|nr:hypothetical protein [Candidatus Lokiarchaeota archaeon]